MKKLLIGVLAASSLATVALPAAAATAWRSVNQRQAAIFYRIDMGVKKGTLTRGEAYQLRTRFNAIARLESQYRRTGGLQAWEMKDLDKRLNALAVSVNRQKTDPQRRY
jgi:hypothetical protein